MTKFILVRHGQDEDNAEGLLNGHRDRPLTDLGRQQAAVVAEKLVGLGIDVAYASPLHRAYETASIIAKRLGIDQVIADQHLIERDFGILTGKPIADIPKYSNQLLQTDRVLYFLEAEGAEDFTMTYRRALTVLDELRQRHPDQTVLVVTHGDLGKMFRAAYHGWNWEQGLKQPYFDNTGVLKLSAEGDAIF
jgi:broad specificity phosphatase PhoE